MQNIVTISSNIKIVTINTIHVHINKSSCIDPYKELKYSNKIDVQYIMHNLLQNIYFFL